MLFVAGILLIAAGLISSIVGIMLLAATAINQGLLKRIRLTADLAAKRKGASVEVTVTL